MAESEACSCLRLTRRVMKRGDVRGGMYIIRNGARGGEAMNAKFENDDDNINKRRAYLECKTGDVMLLWRLEVFVCSR